MLSPNNNKIDSYSRIGVKQLQLQQNLDWPKEVVIQNEKFIKDEFFFKNFIIEETYNVYGTCGYVSAAILLSYYDNFYNSDIVPDKINGTITTKTSSATEIDIKNISNGPGPTKGFHDSLVDFGASKGYQTWLTASATKNIMNSFVSQYSSIGSNKLEGTSVNGLFNSKVITQMKEKIDDNIPVIVCMISYKYYLEGEGTKVSDSMENPHIVVLTGYRETSDGIYFSSHFGWDGSNSSRAWVKPLRVYDYTYMTYTGDHQHSDKYLFPHENHVIKLCPCQDITDNFTLVSSTETYDIFKCNRCLSIIGNQEHQFVEVINFDGTSHILKCEYCDRHTSRPHDFAFIVSKDSHGHYYECRDCGYKYIETHMKDPNYVSNPNGHDYYCEVCKFVIDRDDHHYTYQGSIEDHDKYCYECDFKLTDTHNTSLIRAKDNHVYICACGYSFVERHKFTKVNNIDICQVCRKQRNSISEVNQQKSIMIYLITLKKQMEIMYMFKQ
jgi:hypothetical protein